MQNFDMKQRETTPSTEVSPPPDPVAAERAVLEKKIKSAAHWFYWIAGLSLINAIIILSGSERQFFICLGVILAFNAFVQVITEELNQEFSAKVGLIIKAVTIFIDIWIICVVSAFGYLAGKGKRWAFIVGMICYFLDGILFLMFNDLLSLGLHIFILACLFSGLQSIRKLRALPPPVPVVNANQ